jgi:uncharacterized membrane protein YgdD (TMEM256/DUF423 family)
MSPDPDPELTSRPGAADLAALTAAIFGFSLVVLAAAGSHLKFVGDAPLPTAWQNAQFIHLVSLAALLFLASELRRGVGRALPVAAVLQTTGAILFCGTLYTRVWLDDSESVIPGFLAPIGGITLIVAWLVMAFHYGRRLASET